MIPHVRFTVPGGFLLSKEGSDHVVLLHPTDGSYAELAVERLGQSGIVERLAATPNFVVVASGPVMVGGIRGTS
ncbi:MAG TPA: hypothetical protein VEG29_01390, partial [Candidatus Binatia bacterium]|nr:hypothetical protein [Candidatus Binatia bacterium]